MFDQDYEPDYDVIPEGFVPAPITPDMLPPIPIPLTDEERAKLGMFMTRRFPILVAKSDTCLMACAGECSGLLWAKQRTQNGLKAMPITQLPASKITLHNRHEDGWQCVKCGAISK